MSLFREKQSVRGEIEMQRRDAGYIGRRMLRIERQWRRRRRGGRLKRRFMDAIREGGYAGGGCDKGRYRRQTDGWVIRCGDL